MTCIQFLILLYNFIFMCCTSLFLRPINNNFRCDSSLYSRYLLDYEQSPIGPQGQQRERNASARENHPFLAWDDFCSYPLGLPSGLKTRDICRAVRHQWHGQTKEGNPTERLCRQIFTWGIYSIKALFQYLLTIFEFPIIHSVCPPNFA